MVRMESVQDGQPIDRVRTFREKDDDERSLVIIDAVRARLMIIPPDMPIRHPSCRPRTTRFDEQDASILSLPKLGSARLVSSRRASLRSFQLTPPQHTLKAPGWSRIRKTPTSTLDPAQIPPTTKRTNRTSQNQTPKTGENTGRRRRRWRLTLLILFKAIFQNSIQSLFFLLVVFRGKLFRGGRYRMVEVRVVR